MVNNIMIVQQYPIDSCVAVLLCCVAELLRCVAVLLCRVVKFSKIILGFHVKFSTVTKQNTRKHYYKRLLKHQDM
jgi:hypothetical protein